MALLSTIIRVASLGVASALQAVAWVRHLVPLAIKSPLGAVHLHPHPSWGNTIHPHLGWEQACPKNPPLGHLLLVAPVVLRADPANPGEVRLEEVRPWVAWGRVLCARVVPRGECLVPAHQDRWLARMKELQST